jgi:serine acetyltransferase
MNALRKLEWDWYSGSIPQNVQVHPTAYLETAFSFLLCRSQETAAVSYGEGSATYLGTMFDLGPKARVSLGRFALVHGARIICDAEISIGDYTMISWNVVLMDSYRLPSDRVTRRCELERAALRTPRWAAADVPAHPIHIGPNVWIGFEACVLPGVRIGRGSIVGARAVVTEDVAPFTVVAGNPARAVRSLEPYEEPPGSHYHSPP